MYLVYMCLSYCCMCIYFNVHKYIIAHSGLFFFFTLSIMCFGEGSSVLCVCVFNLLLLTTAQHSMVCIPCIYILLPTWILWIIVQSTSSPHPHPWSSKRLPLRCISSCRMAAWKVWNVCFDWVGWECSLEELLYIPITEHEDSKMPAFH